MEFLAEFEITVPEGRRSPMSTSASPDGRGRRQPASRAGSPDLGGASGWLNSEPLTPDGPRGRVVVIQFCTFSCVNGLRRVPYTRALAGRYSDDGLVVIGVHSPEFPSSTTRRRSRPRSTGWASTIRNSGQRVRRRAGLRQRLLARPLLRRRRGQAPASPLRRGGLRALRAGHPALLTEAGSTFTERARRELRHSIELFSIEGDGSVAAARDPPAGRACANDADVVHICRGVTACPQPNAQAADG